MRVSHGICFIQWRHAGFRRCCHTRTENPFRPKRLVSSATEAKPPANQAGPGCYLNFWLRRSNGALVGPLNTPSLTHVSQSKGFLPGSQWLRNIKRLEPLAGCLAWMFYEQSNAIRVDCVIFQSVSTLQPDGRHVMNMKRCLKRAAGIDWLLHGGRKPRTASAPPKPFNRSPGRTDPLCFYMFYFRGKDSNISLRG